MTLLSMDEIRKFNGISYEEDRCVISYQIIVPFCGVKLYGKATGVAHGICRAKFARNSGEAYKQGRAFTNLG